MTSILKAALFGAVLATAVFFAHFLMPLLLLLLFIGLMRRAIFGPRWRYAYAGYGHDCGTRGRYRPRFDGAQRTPTVDGRDWQRPSGAADAGRDVQVN